jgi:hypothetical protein
MRFGSLTTQGTEAGLFERTLSGSYSLNSSKRSRLGYGVMISGRRMPFVQHHQKS